MRTGFRTQLTAVIGLVAAAMVVAIPVVGSALITDKVTRNQGDALQALGRSTSTMLGEGLHERLREIELLTESPEIDVLRKTPIRSRAPSTAFSKSTATIPRLAWPPFCPAQQWRAHPVR